MTWEVPKRQSVHFARRPVTRETDPNKVWRITGPLNLYLRFIPDVPEMTSGTPTNPGRSDVPMLDYGQVSGQPPIPAEVPIRNHIGKSTGHSDESTQSARQLPLPRTRMQIREPRPKPTVETRSLEDGAGVSTRNWWGPKLQKKVR